VRLRVLGRRRRLRVLPRSAGAVASGYDAFISYSHAVDRRLAPALQRGLHQLAKPWYRLRALRVFRDDASLSANPDLWVSIQAALESSRFFILLASPESASSPWVRREIDFWCQHKPATRLLIVVTDGVVAWDTNVGGFDWHKTTALPRCLQGRFEAEPRWVDFRWVRTQEHLSLNDPRFRDGVAELAAPLHGRVKDELFGEDVRQHRRTKMLARSAIAMVTTLAIIASSAALVAARNGQEARRERDRAEWQLRLAMSRQLAATAELNAATRPLQSILLSVQAFNEADTVEAHRGLLKQLQNQENVKRLLGGHSTPVCAVAFSPDGRTLASADLERTVRIWDGQNQRNLATLMGEVGSTQAAVAFSPDGRTLAAAGQTTGSRKIVTLWDVARGVRVATLTGGIGWISHVVFSPDGHILAADSGKTITLWDVNRRTRVATLSGNGRGRRTQVAFSPDGRTLAADSGDEITLWDVARRIPTATLAGHRGTVTSLAFAPDGRTLASVGDDHTVRLWDVTRRTRPATLPGDRRLATLTASGDGWRGGWSKLTFSPDGRTLAVSPGAQPKIHLWDITQRTEVGVLTGHVGYTCAVAFSPDGRTVASGGYDGLVRLWDVARRGDLPPSDNSAYPTPYVSRMVFSPRGRTLALIRGDDHTVSLWDVAQRSDIATLPRGRGTVAFSPDGGTLASASRDRTIRLWNPAKPARPTAILRGHIDLVSDLVFSPDGRTLASAGRDGTIRLWDPAKPARPTAILRGHTGVVSDLVFSPDGHTLVSGSLDGTVRLWDMASRTLLATLPGHSHQSLGLDPIPAVFSRDGHTLAFTNGRTIYVWDVARRTRLAALPHRGWGSAVTLSPDGQTLASATGKELTLWDVTRRIPIATLTGHDAEVSQVLFGRDGRTLASASHDGTVRLWSVASRTQLGILALHKRPVLSLALSPDGHTLASASYDGAVRISDIGASSWRQRLCAIAGRSFTRAEWAEFLPQHAYKNSCETVP
jgi:WD40 repeat protein